jgi:DNA-binding Xre family transcriptional regulator
MTQLHDPLRSDTERHEHNQLKPDGASPKRAVQKLRRKLLYAAPQLSAIPRVVPVGYEEPDPDRVEAAPLRNLRHDRAMSIRELAERSGISASTIYRIEQGKTEPRPFVIYALSGALNCSYWEVSEFRDIMASISLPR